MTLVCLNCGARREDDDPPKCRCDANEMSESDLISAEKDNRRFDEYHESNEYPA